MLTENEPDPELIEWSANFVNNPFDRPWFYEEEPPLVAIDCFQPPCRCSRAVKLHKHDCEGNSGYFYLGQCEYCETIIWTFKAI